MMNSLGEVVTRLCSSVVVSAVSAAYWYRPVPNKGNSEAEPCRDGFMSRINYSEDCNRNPPLMLSVAQHFAIFFTVSASHLVLKYTGTLKLRDDDNHKKLISLITSRPKGVPLITVSNHRSILDEPCLLSVIMPWHVGIQPRFLRWSVCTQDICFKNDLFSSFFGAGKTLPIVRGHGVDQKLFLDFARHLAAGQWTHVFPEAGCWWVERQC